MSAPKGVQVTTPNPCSCVEGRMFFNTADTTDDTPENIFVVDTDSDTMYLVEVYVIAVETDANDEGETHKLIAGFNNDGGTLAIMTSQTILHEKETTSATDVALTTSGDDIVVQITGISANLNWKAWMRVFRHE